MQWFGCPLKPPAAAIEKKLARAAVSWGEKVPTVVSWRSLPGATAQAAWNWRTQRRWHLEVFGT